MKQRHLRSGAKLIGASKHPSHHLPRPKHSSYHRLYHPPQPRQDPSITDVLRMSNSPRWRYVLRHLLDAFLCVLHHKRLSLEVDAHISKRVPKGHLVVYVEREDGWGSERFLVPVVFVNHPLFVELLKDAEAKNGFSHRGGLTVPCDVSVFEDVHTRIAASWSGRRRPQPALCWREADGLHKISVA